MARKLLSVEEFRAVARSGEKPDDAMVLRASTGPVEMVPGSRRVKFVFSDGSVDRSGDTINPAGWQLDNYKKNPVALFGHDSWNISSVIGRGVNVGQSGNKLIGEIDFADADINPSADMAYKMVEAGLLSAVSVGFMPLEFAWSTDKDRPYGMDFTKQELLEISLVPVPCNQNAVIQAKALGINTGPLAEWAEQILDGEGRVPVHREFLESVFRDAKTPQRVQQKYLAEKSNSEIRVSHASDWKVGAARGLPIDESEAWDGPAAAARMFAAAGFDGDSPDVSSIRRGFLIYDSSAQKLKGSYKLPFADISGGELKAVRGGIRAAASRLPQTDAPANVLDEARTVLNGYEKTDTQEGGKGFVMRAGRTISAATAASLQEIMAHHAAAAESCKAAAARCKAASDMCTTMMGDNNSNVDGGDGMGDMGDMGNMDPADVHDPVTPPPKSAKELDRERRIRQAEAIRIASEIAAA